MERPRNRRRPWPRTVARVFVSVFLLAAATQVAELPEARGQQDTLARIEKMSSKAMESFDMLDYETAKKLLTAAVARAKTEGLELEPVVARVYLNLGIVYFSGENDVDSARVAFIDAVRIDPTIQIDPVYKTGDMEALLDEVKAELGGEEDGGVDCAAVQGLEHMLIDLATAGVERPIEAAVGQDVEAARVALYYRVHGTEDAAVDFTEVDMTRADGCVYRAAIPASALTGGVVHYYIEAYDPSGQVVGASGSERTPNLIEVQIGGADPDNPLAVEKEATGAGPARWFVAGAIGTGGGYVTGETEQTQSPINCCFAPALVHFLPEVGYYLSPGASLSLAFRLGLPIGANIERHATAAPAAIVRYRRALAGSGDGLFVSGALGGGVIRQTVELANPTAEDMNVDTSAIGPLLLGGGAGYAHALGDSLRFIAEVNLTAGVPVVGELGTAQLNFGLQVDANLGFLMSF